jgi:hypothetical protein
MPEGCCVIPFPAGRKVRLVPLSAPAVILPFPPEAAWRRWLQIQREQKTTLQHLLRLKPLPHHHGSDSDMW